MLFILLHNVLLLTFTFVAHICSLDLGSAFSVVTGFTFPTPGTQSQLGRRTNSSQSLTLVQMGFLLGSHVSMLDTSGFLGFFLVIVSSIL